MPKKRTTENMKWSIKPNLYTLTFITLTLYGYSQTDTSTIIIGIIGTIITWIIKKD